MPLRPLQCVIGKGHTVLEREHISLCQQHEQIASFSDDEMEMPSNTGEAAIRFWYLACIQRQSQQRKL